MAAEKRTPVPAELPPRTAPTWLRLLAPAGIGLGLALAPLFEGARAWVSGESADPRKTAEDFLAALRNKDPETMKGLLVAQARHADFIGLRLPAPEFWLPCLVYEARGAEGSGQNVEVPFVILFKADAVPPAQANAHVHQMLPEAQKLNGREGAVLLQWAKAEGRWLVSGVHILEKNKPPTIYDFTSSLPDLLEQLQAHVLKQKRPAFDKLAALDARTFAAAWRMNGTVQDRPAREVLEQVLGLTVSVADADRAGQEGALAALGKRVTLDLKGRSRLGAAEEVCRQAGLHPRYTKTGLTPERGPRPWPAAVAGPFLLEVLEVQEFPPYGRGVVKLRCLSAGLPHGVIGARADAGVVFLPQALGPVWLDHLEVPGAGGMDLLLGGKARFTQLFGFLQLAPPGTAAERGIAQVPLKNLLADLETLPRLAGRVRVALPGVEEFRFEPLTADMAKNGKETRWVLHQVDGQPRILVLEGTGVAGRYLLWMAYDGAGNALRFGETPLAADGAQPLLLPEAATALVLKVVGPGEQVEYPFEVRDIPLKGRPPRRLDPPHFAGKEAPVAVSVQKFVPAVQLSIANTCQKDIEKVILKLTFRSGTGQVLAEEVRSAEKLGSAQPEVLVAAGGKVSHMLGGVANPLAGSTMQVDVRVIRVEFMDATSWQP